MLVLSRKVGERVVIGDSIVLTVVRVQGDRVRIGIEAPHEVPVMREELVRPPVPALQNGSFAPSSQVASN